ncbi:MAG: hypothetical protein QOI29_2883 [Mycobacterium sp.]|jgi:hypothetical protein|nr:hypothetical protein [Mycobacterium sp.]
MTSRWLVAAIGAAFVLGVTCVLPLVVHDDLYGDVPIPGSGTVHLPPGNVDVTLRSQRPDDDAHAIRVPPLSIRISGPDGTPQPELIESRRAKCVNSDCDIQTRIWVVRVLREGDYHVTIDGEVYGPYQPTLAFGHVVWNDFLLAPLALGSVLRWLVLIVAAVAVALCLAVAGVVSMFHTSDPQTEEPANPPRAQQLRHDPPATAAGVHGWPARELVLPYPEPRGRVGKFIVFVLFFLLLVGGPVAGIYSWFHLPGGAPVSWIPVVVLAGLGAGFGWILGRVVVRWAVVRNRRARGDGWLWLSSAGFEVHARWGKPRRYEWCEVDGFMLVETRDGEGDVVSHVGLRFSPELRRADRHVDGYWDGPLDDAVDLMNEWLARYAAARHLESL